MIIMEKYEGDVPKFVDCFLAQWVFGVLLFGPLEWR
jgi:hypothetical protein